MSNVTGEMRDGEGGGRKTKEEDERRGERGGKVSP